MNQDKKTRHAEEQRRYREKYPEKIAASNRAYYQKNRDRITAHRKAAREASPLGTSMGRLLREHRKGLGLSQQAYAQRLGVTQAALSGWERGRTPVRIETVADVFPELASALQKEKEND